MSTDAVLVTGALGLVGSAVVGQLAGEGRRVVATDLDLPRNRKKAGRLLHAGDVELRWADLTDSTAVLALVESVRPAAIVHLAAIIPPACYANRALARRVNLDATASLFRAGSTLAEPPRFLLASSIAVYGARNPHRGEVLTASTPVDPCDLYGALKVEAEAVVTGSDLDWSILRLGGVLTPTLHTDAGMDMLAFERVLPVDGRLQTVDARDVACAFSAATVTEATREVFLIGGDDSHRVVQGTLGPSMMAAVGLEGVLSQGRRGDPDSDSKWFATDWMEVSRAQEVLGFQHRSLPEIFAEAAAVAGWRRRPMRAVSPLARMYLRSRSPYRHFPGEYADPWGAIERLWGDPLP